MRFLFWLSLSLLLYVYIGYPLLIALLARLAPCRSDRFGRPARRPTVSVLIVAYNEAATIREKLDNAFRLDYPADSLQVVLASDGSTDGTVDLATPYVRRGLRLISFPARRGKISAINDAIRECTGEIVVFSDCRQIYRHDALRQLVRPFDDPSVGAVSGELHLAGAEGATATGIGFYWRYEKFIRRRESRFDSSVGATGAIYAIRRRLFRPIPPDTVLDDVLIPLRIARTGYRILFEPRAQAFDAAATTPREEFTRKVRTIAGTWQLFARERWLWSPAANRLWFQTLSHKALRLLGPLLLLGSFAASGYLAVESTFYLCLFLGQSFFYAIAAAGLFAGHLPFLGRWVALPFAFCLLNVATLVSAVRFLRSDLTPTWQKAAPASSR